MILTLYNRRRRESWHRHIVFYIGLGNHDSMSALVSYNILVQCWIQVFSKSVRNVYASTVLICDMFRNKEEVGMSHWL